MPYPEPDIRVRERSLAVLDDRTNSPIIIYFDPYLRRWRAYLMRYDGRFYREVSSLNVCGCAVAEYCARSDDSGNVYVDTCYCEGIELNEINLKFTPHWEVIAAFHAGQRDIYYKRISEILPKMRNYLLRRIKQEWANVEDALNDLFRDNKGLETIVDIDYDGFFVSVTLFCPGVYYGIFCRMSKRGCAKTKCRSLCDAGLAECDEEEIRGCIRRKKIAL